MHNIAIIMGGKLKQAARMILNGYPVYEEVKTSDTGNLAKELESQGVQAIITTGGTITEISRHVEIPVVTADLTYFDLLETLKEMETALVVINKRIAMVLHSSLSVSINRLQPFICNEVSLVQYQDIEQIEEIVSKLVADKYDVLVGGPTAKYYAKHYGIQSFLLRYGEETMDTAIKKATSVVDITQKDREEHQKLQAVLDISPDGILATDQEGNITLCNPNALRILQATESDVIGNKVDKLMEDNSWKDVYTQGIMHTDLMREYYNKKFFVTRQPIVVNSRVIGSVGTFQEADKIEKLEHQYRTIRTKGLVARYRFSDIIAKSLCMKSVSEQAKAYASVDSTVLIEGETGTGKEIFAQSMHNQSQRSEGPFVAINCAALPETLLESELMGYEEGAFTGAKRGGKAGLFELAHKGTIFFDEINQIPLNLQARVLRVIQERMVLRLGGEKVIPVDVHIIAASNENLANKVQQGKFRDDLYYRLNVLTLKLPPLRERMEDIPLLLEHYLRKFSALYGIVPELSTMAIQNLTCYAWPGNIRELRNFIERYVVLNSKMKISEMTYVSDFLGKRKAQAYQDIVEPDMLTVRMGTFKDMEEQILKQIVERCGGNQFQAAIMLGISRTTIWNRLKNIIRE